MARRDWPELKAEFDKLNEGDNKMSLSEFCRLKGINRSTATNHFKVKKTIKKPKKTKAQIDDLSGKLKFFAEQNELSKKKAEFVAAIFENPSITDASKQIGVTVRCGYNWIKDPAVMQTIDDIQACNFEVKTTTPNRIRGRMCIIANASMKNYFDEKGDFKEPHKWTRAEGLAVKEFKVKPTEHGNEYTIKLYDAIDAIKTLGNVHGLFSKPDESDELKNMSDDDLEALIDEQQRMLEKIQVQPTDPADS